MIRRVLAILLASVFSVTASSGSEPVYVQEKLQYAEITNKPLVDLIRAYIVPKLKENGFRKKKHAPGELEIIFTYDDDLWKMDKVVITITPKSDYLPSQCSYEEYGYSIYGTTIGGYDFRVLTKLGSKYLDIRPGKYNVEYGWLGEIKGIYDNTVYVPLNILEDKILNSNYNLYYDLYYNHHGPEWDFDIPEEFPVVEDAKANEAWQSPVIKAAFADSLGPSQISPPQFAPPAEPLPIPHLPKKKR